MQSSIDMEIGTSRVFSFPCQKYRFTMQAVDPILLPYYKGSTFRGAFGMAFKKIVCALRQKSCSECILKSRCVYSYIFETIPPENTNIMNKTISMEYIATGDYSEYYAGGAGNPYTTTLTYTITPN